MRNKLWLVFWTIALTLLFTVASRADDYSFKYGMGLLNGSPTGNIKLFSLREEQRLSGPIHSATEGGVWVDNLGNGRRGAAFGKYQLGVKPGPDVGFYGSIFWGLQLQSSTDTELGGNAQFSQDFGLGIRDAASFVQGTYTHMSSAGIFLPNRGRDFFCLNMGLRF